ncbi:MAG: hypothetical protein A2W87_09175 [Bacteroidetes bacterium GWC2_46_850]|jgi:hypothetical protein|nr:MAG: hypothetical protein A2W87_09175 [Bacteroidetes bacterium GWC2_46_850]
MYTLRFFNTIFQRKKNGLSTNLFARIILISYLGCKFICPVTGFGEFITGKVRATHLQTWFYAWKYEILF